MTSDKLIMTHSGLMTNPFALMLEDINIEDIAHSLSFICRFNGHIKNFYSVAAHCLIGAEEFRKDKDLAKAFLVHDASEAFFGDMLGPVKHTLEMIEYQKYEHLAQDVIHKALGIHIGPAQVKLIKTMDHQLFCNESAELQHHLSPHVNKRELSSHLMQRVNFYSRLTPRRVERIYLKLFSELDNSN